VADAVYVERVSATEFPANREINKENPKLSSVTNVKLAIYAASIGFSARSSLKFNREAFALNREGSTR
jgi:hypothetical protein